MNTFEMTLLAGGLAAALTAAALPAPAQTVESPAAPQRSSTCADCHVANVDRSPAPEHFREWELSAHGRAGVGCESCHGGDPSTFDSFRAHRDVLATSNPSSPTHRRNVAATCGACHAGAYLAYRRGPHFPLLASDVEIPTCTDCHGAVGAHLLSSRTLEARCSRCHGGDAAYPMPEIAHQARLLLEGIGHVRALLQQARPLIDRVTDATRRQQLLDAYHQAEVPLTEATDIGHGIGMLAVTERLDIAQLRAEALLELLANPDGLER